MMNHIKLLFSNLSCGSEISRHLLIQLIQLFNWFNKVRLEKLWFLAKYTVLFIKTANTSATSRLLREPEDDAKSFWNHALDSFNIYRSNASINKRQQKLLYMHSERLHFIINYWGKCQTLLQVVVYQILYVIDIKSGHF